MLLVIPLIIGEWVEFPDLYWRIVVAITILAAVGTALIPLVNALFAPKKPRPAHLTRSAAWPTLPQPWPTYADGVTPLPVMPDGSPDWNAYYTGLPVQRVAGDRTGRADGSSRAAGWQQPRGTRRLSAQPPPPSAGYEGYPPPPPLPPRP